MTSGTSRTWFARATGVTLGFALVMAAVLSASAARADSTDAVDPTLGTVRGLVIQWPTGEGEILITLTSDPAGTHIQTVTLSPSNSATFLFTDVPAGNYDLLASIIYPLDGPGNVDGSGSLTVVAGQETDFGTITVSWGFGETEPAYTGGVAAITGSAVVGQTLTGTADGFTPSGATVTYQWGYEEAGATVPIEGATGSTLLVTEDMIGRTIVFTATAYSSGITAASASATTGPVTDPASRSGTSADVLAATGTEPGPLLAYGIVGLVLGGLLVIAARSGSPLRRRWVPDTAVLDAVVLDTAVRDTARSRPNRG